MLDNFFPYGAQYYRTPNPPQADWEQDLRQMKAQGMNTVRLWAMWSWIHLPGNEFDFSHLEKLMDLCREIGLKALIQLILENAPAWLVSEYPEARYVANDGQPIQPMGRPNAPGGGWPGLCLDNQPVRDAAEAFMTALASHFDGHDALLGYDVWNEVWFELDGYIGSQYYCYCSATARKFRDYLEDKYVTLDGLNDAWYRRYTSWDEIQPPRYWGGYPDWLDWIKFRLANQGDLLSWRVETLRRADPDVLLVSHGLPTTLGSTCTHLTDDWRNAARVDVYGLSCFPLWFNYDNIETFRVHDMIRGACRGKTFWTAETQAGPSGEGLVHSKTPTPEEIRLWNWISLASGAKGLLYWQWRPELLGPESPGFGLCHLNGAPTDRTRAASEFARLTSSSDDLLSSQPMRGEVAIAVLPESQILCHVADKNAGKYAQAVRGAYRAFAEAGYQVDFAQVDDLSAYPLVYLPFPLMIEPNSAKKLADYVRDGGLLISEACPAQFGEVGYAQVRTPGYGLDEVFGVHALSGPESINGDAPTIRWCDSEVWCTVHRQRLVADGCEVLAEYSDGGPAVVRNSFGSGSAILIGTYPGIGLEWGCREAGLLVTSIARRMGVSPRAYASDPDVWARAHICGEDVLIFAINMSFDDRSIMLRLPDGVANIAAIDLVSGDIVDVMDGGYCLNIAGLDAKVLKLPSRAAALLSPDIFTASVFRAD